jgi:O-methyltransferase involved in polyketide biosynthesis
MTELSEVDGNILDGVSATALWTLHNRGSEAMRSDGLIRDPWAVTLYDAITYDYRKFSRRTLKGHKLAAWPPLDRVGFMRRIRPGITLLEFAS